MKCYGIVTLNFSEKDFNRIIRNRKDLTSTTNYMFNNQADLLQQPIFNMTDNYFELWDKCISSILTDYNWSQFFPDIYENHIKY